MGRSTTLQERVTRWKCLSLWRELQDEDVGHQGAHFRMRILAIREAHRMQQKSRRILIPVGNSSSQILAHDTTMLDIFGDRPPSSTLTFVLVSNTRSLLLLCYVGTNISLSSPLYMFKLFHASCFLVCCCYTSFFVGI